MNATKPSEPQIPFFFALDPFHTPISAKKKKSCGIFTKDFESEITSFN
ncbi:hypothetical protein ERO13_A04G043966v2 [Gossypium hirsutum]|nr:hypothetical protein ERO13_A04G043966v2 [Gossypium hirsutum]